MIDEDAMHISELSILTAKS